MVVSRSDHGRQGIKAGMDGYPPDSPAITMADRTVAEAFVLAMRAELADAPYGAPYATEPAQREWLIISRWGQSAEYLTLSRTGIAADDSVQAPEGLYPRETFLGVRVASPPTEPCFLLLRHQPCGTAVAGDFVPSDGFIRLSGPTGALRLTGAGRHALLRGVRNGSTIYADVPWPPEGAAGAQAWAITAMRCPWRGEFVERPLA
jgi:hypothetical protein